MKAAVYLGPKRLEVRDIPIPTLKSRDVLVKVAYCGICGTDVHIFSGDGGAAEVEPPLVIGHEFSGVVEAVGSEVTKVRRGDRVSVDPNDMCGQCYFCRNGKEHFCKGFTGIGTTANGGFAEYCVVPEKQVYNVEGIDLLSAAMAEPLSCCIHGIELCDIRPGSEVLIIGGGPIGLLMLQLSKLSGAGKVGIVVRSKEKAVSAAAAGADLVINMSNESADDIIRREFDNLDTVIECVGSTAMIENAVEWAGMGAVVMLFGLTAPDATAVIKPSVIFKKELRITSSFINPYTYERSIKLLRSGRIDVLSSVKNIIALDQLAEALSSDSLRKRGKVVVKLYDDPQDHIEPLDKAGSAAL